MDVRTLTTMLALAQVVLAFVLLLEWRVGHIYDGLGWWTAGQALFAAGFVLAGLRGDNLIGKVMIVLSATASVSGTVLIYRGVERFVGGRHRSSKSLWLLVAWLALLSYFTFGPQEMSARRVLMVLAYALVFLLTAWMLWRRRLPTAPRSTRFLTTVFAFAGVANLVTAPFEVASGDRTNTLYGTTVVLVVWSVGVILYSVLWTFGLVLMVSERLLFERRAQADNVERILDTSPGAMVITRLDDGLIVDMNQEMCALTGYGKEEALGKSVIDLGIYRDAAVRRQLVTQLRNNGECFDLPAELVRADGEAIDIVIGARQIQLFDAPHLVGMLRDVTAERRREAELAAQAATDELTGIPNRRALLETAEGLFRWARSSQRSLTLALLDLDGFKDINDTYGHLLGDDALRRFTQTVGQQIDVSDVFGRLGGDEFALLVPQVTVDEAIEKVTKIRDAVEQVRIEVPGGTVRLEFSAGLAATTDGEIDSLNDLLAAADRALYQAKGQSARSVTSG